MIAQLPAFLVRKVSPGCQSRKLLKIEVLSHCSPTFTFKLLPLEKTRQLQTVLRVIYFNADISPRGPPGDVVRYDGILQELT